MRCRKAAATSAMLALSIAAMRSARVMRVPPSAAKIAVALAPKAAKLPVDALSNVAPKVAKLPVDALSNVALKAAKLPVDAPSSAAVKQNAVPIAALSSVAQPPRAVAKAVALNPVKWNAALAKSAASAEHNANAARSANAARNVAVAIATCPKRLAAQGRWSAARNAANHLNRCSEKEANAPPFCVALASSPRPNTKSDKMESVLRWSAADD